MNKLFSCLCVGLILCVASNNDVLGKRHGRHSRPSGGKIVGGYNVTIEEVPHQVYLLLMKGVLFFQCGGSLISSKAVLTAAHCLTGYYPIYFLHNLTTEHDPPLTNGTALFSTNPVRIGGDRVMRVFIRAGSADSQSGGTQYSTSLYSTHPKYNPATNDYDVGVIRTLREMTLDGVTTKAIALPEMGQEVPSGLELLVSGWGTTSENGQTSRYLMAVKVPVVSYEDCRTAYGENAITERMVCAGLLGEGGKDSCQGDSGGPAIDESSGLLIGVVSFGRGCARPDYPGVYSNVSSFRDWIETAAGV